MLNSLSMFIVFRILMKLTLKTYNYVCQSRKKKRLIIDHLIQVYQIKCNLIQHNKL